MPCQICSATGHTADQCPQYQGIHQSIRDFIDEILRTHPFSTAPARTSAQSLTDQFYCLYSGPVEWDLRESYGTTFGIAERVYLCVPPAHLDHVWALVKQNFTREKIASFKFAKVCTMQDAAKRRDTIVIYVARDGTRDVLHKLIALHTPSRARPGQRAPAPPLLKKEYFSDLVPRTTLPTPNLRGISAADDPGPSVSYGGLICGALAEAHQGCDGTKWGFVRQVIATFGLKRISLTTPWKKL